MVMDELLQNIQDFTDEIASTISARYGELLHDGGGA
jgi:hypothetical protein